MRIVIEDNAIDLTISVNTAIGEGWMPQGGVAHNSVNLKYYQAMVKYEAKDSAPQGSTFHQWEQQEHVNNKNIAQ